MPTIKYIINIIGSHGDAVALIAFGLYSAVHSQVNWIFIVVYLFGRIVGDINGYTFAFDAIEKGLKKKGLI